jgi:AcrR family transcriptional regulator
MADQGARRTAEQAPAARRTAEQAPAGAGRPLRVDAERNRRRIVDAAVAAFAERGLAVPLEEIADRAGVGIGTLYRRFPTRELLVAAVFEAGLTAYAEAAEKALEASDPWAGFCGLVEWICTKQAADRGFTDVLTMTLPLCTGDDGAFARGSRAMAALVRRAQEQGVLREDLVPEDILLLIIANAGVVHGPRAAAPHAWRRFLTLMLESFRAGHAGPLPAAPTPLQMHRSMVQYAQLRGICVPEA